MSRKILPAEKFESSTTATVEMTEIDGMEQGTILCFTDAGRSGQPSKAKKLRTCYGDLYVIVNALRDYANLLEGAIQECRKIAGKYAAAIGYDYDKAIVRCEKRRAKGNHGGDTGMDGLEALVRKKEIIPPKQGKINDADRQQKGN